MTCSPDGISIRPLLGLPEITDGVDLAELLVRSLTTTGDGIRPGDVVLVSSKVVSKELGLTRSVASKAAVVAEETVRVVAERATATGTTRVVESVAGPVMAAGGVDASNVGPEEGLLVLPRDADAEARRLRAGMLRTAGLDASTPFGVIITDTAGRPWRAGQTDFALGSAGVLALRDHRGGHDHDGRPLSVTAIAVADELAAAADLVKGKAMGIPAALVRGVPGEWFSDHPDSRTAASLVRRGPGDWFALGHREAVRAALGIAAGSDAATDVGIPPLADETLQSQVSRVVATALHAQGEEVAADIGVADDAVADVSLSAGDAFGLGRLLARLEVAAAGEGLGCTVGEPTASADTVTVRLTRPH